MNRLARRKDINQAAIEQVLKQLGITYHDTSRLGFGWPDLATTDGVRVWLFEVKQPGKESQLTDDERQFAQRWPVVVVTTLEQVLEEMHGHDDHASKD